MHYLVGHEQSVELAQMQPALTGLALHSQPCQQTLHVTQKQDLHGVQSHWQCEGPQDLMEEQVHLLEPAQFVKMDVAPAMYPRWADQAHVSYVS